MNQLLLLSSTSVNGGEPFTHCSEAIEKHLGATKQVLFVPYALNDWEGYSAFISKSFQALGYAIKSIHLAEDPVKAIQSAEAIYVGGGNTFRLLKAFYDLNLITTINSCISKGLKYMGSSAGSNLACPTIKTTNDMPIVEPPSLKALSRIKFQINAHYNEPDPGSKQHGETRMERLIEYTEENETPVLALRDESWLAIEEDSCVLQGSAPAILMGKNQPKTDIDPGTNLTAI